MATARGDAIAQGVPLAVPSSDESDLEDITVIPNSPQSVCEDEEGVAIVSIAKSILVYRIPRFPVVTINLRQFTFEAVLPDNSSAIYDGFIQEDPSLDTYECSNSTYATIRVIEYCFVEVRA